MASALSASSHVTLLYVGLALFMAAVVAAACAVLIAQCLRQGWRETRSILVVGGVVLMATVGLAIAALVDDQNSGPRPPTVAVQADWLTYATALATVTAAGLALISIVYSAAQARKAEAALLLERRLDFELTLLAEMSRQFSITGAQHLSGYARALLPASAPDDDLPVLRAFTGVRDTPACTARLQQVSEEAKGGKSPIDARFDAQDAVRQAIGEEIVAAIDRRLPR